MARQVFGHVSWFNVAKGYGEIVAEDKSVYFFTFRDLVSHKKFKTIKDNAAVKFTTSEKTMFGMSVATEIKEVRENVVAGLESTNQQVLDL